MRRRHWGPLLLAALAIVATAGCGADDTSTGGPGSTEKIRVGRLGLVDAVPLHLAIDNGFFKAEGLEVELTTGAKGSVNVDKLLGSELDFGLTSYPPAITAHAKARDLRVVSDAVRTTKDSILVVVNPDGPIKKLEDLVGKKIANSSKRGISELALNTQFRAKGIDPAAVQYISTEIASMPAMVKRGDVEAAIIAEPHLTAALKEGVTPLADPFTGTTADFPWSGWFSTKKYTDAHPETVKKFQRAMTKGAEMANKDPELVRQTLVKHIKVDDNGSSINTIPMFPPTIDVAQLQRVVDLMRDEGELDSDKKPINVDMKTMMIGS